MIFYWAAILAISTLLYVLLDGLDLGVGIISGGAGSHARRDAMMNAIAPIWDGNETWLILGGVTLFAAFPVAYAVALPAFYIPVMLLLFSRIFRGVAFEFRAKAQASKRWIARVASPPSSCLPGRRVI